MVQVKAKKDKANPVKDNIAGDGEELISHRVEIFRITVNQPQFYEVKVKKVDHQENENRPACPDHKPGKCSCLRFIPYRIPHGPREPVLYLEDDPVGNMNENCQEKQQFNNLNGGKGGHEMSCSVEL